MPEAVKTNSRFGASMPSMPGCSTAVATASGIVATASSVMVSAPRSLASSAKTNNVAV